MGRLFQTTLSKKVSKSLNSMKFDIQMIAKVINANVQGNFRTGTRGIFPIDTEKLPFAHKTLFFALKGHKKNGHDFIPAAYRIGARAFVVEEHYQPEILLEDTVIFRVIDPLSALQTLAAQYRNALTETIFVGITGSNGKTIVKEWLATLIPKEISVGRSPGSYNSQIGVPLSLLSIKPSDDIALIEAGISCRRNGYFKQYNPTGYWNIYRHWKRP